jgi:hypothetical protein
MASKIAKLVPIAQGPRRRGQVAAAEAHEAVGHHGPNRHPRVCEIRARRLRLPHNRARHHARAPRHPSRGASACVRHQVLHARPEAEREDDVAGGGPPGVGRGASGFASHSRQRNAVCDGEGVPHGRRARRRVPEVIRGNRLGFEFGIVFLGLLIIHAD